MIKHEKAWIKGFYEESRSQAKVSTEDHEDWKSNLLAKVICEYLLKLYSY